MSAAGLSLAGDAIQNRMVVGHRWHMLCGPRCVSGLTTLADRMTVAQRLACLEGASALGILGVSAVLWLPAAASGPGDFASPALVVLLTTLLLRVAVYALAKRPPFAERVVIIAVGALARELAEAGPGHGRAHSGPMTSGRAHSAHLLPEGRNV